MCDTLAACREEIPFVNAADHFAFFAGDYYSKDSKHEAEVHPPLVLQFPGEEDAGSDALSTSSLRRKLFGQAGLRAPGTPTKSVASEFSLKLLHGRSLT